VVVTTTLQELQAGAGGGWVPMRDLIRMASHAYHYLGVFDEHTARPLYLAETKRIATPARRIVLHAKDCPSCAS
jgi:malate synthase